MNTKTALLVIDVQKGLFSIPGAPIYNGEKMLANIASLINKARHYKIPVIYIQHNSEKGGFLEKNTLAWQIHPAIAPLEGDLVIEKGTPDSFHETVLKSELDKLGITKLVITGLQTDFCVDTSCRRAYSLGYESILVEDGHSTLDSRVLDAPQIIAHHNHVLGSWFCRVQPTSEIDFD